MILSHFTKIFRPRKQVIIKNYTKHCFQQPHKKALLYYKTDVFFDSALADRYTHTNNWEIICITQILNQLGFSIDIIDRSISPEQLDQLPYNEYSLFLGLGAGNSGRYFERIAARLPKTLKIFYAAGPDPDQSNTWTLGRYDALIQRHPEAAGIKPRRTIDFVKIKESMLVTDVIFCVGNAYTRATYDQYKKPIYPIRPSSSPLLSLSLSDLTSRQANHFLYFGGNGHIVKGLDLVIEAFQELPDQELFICGPEEPEFETLYRIRSAPPKNIHWIGFVDVCGPTFREVTSHCSYIILPSCSEGIATSVTTCMRRGLIPIVTPETGIDTGSFGELVQNPYDKEQLKTRITALSELPIAERTDRSIQTYLNSFQYTQGQFERDMTEGLVKALHTFGRI